MNVASEFTWIGSVLIVTVACAGCSALNPGLSAVETSAFGDQLVADVTRAEITGRLTMEKAVAMALERNRGLSAKSFEVALAYAKTRAESGGMLPNLLVEAQNFHRDRPSLSRSSASSVYSTSSDLNSVSRDVSLSWNILDFGLSYVRAQQGLDKARQQEEELRRVQARLVEDTRVAFWRAVALQRLEQGYAVLRGELEAELAVSRKAGTDPALDPMVSINYQRETLNLRRELNGLEISLAGAVDQLKQAIGAPNVQKLQLDGDRTVPAVTLPTTTAAEDVGFALRNRPEVRQLMYDLRISDFDVEAAVLQVLPGITFSRRFSHDQNPFLLHADWITWGSRLVTNLMQIARLPAELDAIDAQQQALRENAIATAAVISMQVHVARARFAVQMRLHRDALRFASVQRQLFQQVRAATAVGRVPRQAVVREKLATLLADIRAVVSFADLQAAQAAYTTAIGGETPTSEAVSADSRRGARSGRIAVRSGYPS